MLARSSMRTRLLLVTSAVVFALASFACGSEDSGDPTPTTPTDTLGGGGKNGTPGDSTKNPVTSTPPSGPGVGEQNEGAPSNESQNPGGDPGGNPGGDPGGNPGGDPGGNPGGGNPGGNPGGANPGGTGGTGGAGGIEGPPGGGGGIIPKLECKADSIREVESNDTPETANELIPASTYCGTIDAADVDHIAFVLPEDAKEVSWRADWAGEGAPAVSITVEGVTVKGGEPVPFFPGKRYVIKVENAGDKASDYVIAVGFKR